MWIRKVIFILRYVLKPEISFFCWVFHTFLPCTFSLVLFSFGESFYFCLCPSYFSLWFRIMEQGGISRAHCLMCSLTWVPFSWVSFSIWHCCWPSGILDGALLVSRLQLSRQMAFHSKSHNLDTLTSMFFLLLVWCSHNMQKAVPVGILSYGISYGH